jgi:mono/diheme cytochrome c family protein
MRWLALIFLIGCTKAKNSSAPSETAQIDLVQRGKLVYISNCISCHNANPQLNGALGPALAGASLELLQLKVVHGTYPKGYTPLRSSMQMPVFPHLEKDIEALHKYLNQM